MYAIVNFKGSQFKVEQDEIVQVPYLGDLEIGAEIKFEDILMLRNDQETRIGRPTIENVSVTAEIIAHKKAKKIIVFKKKRRKGYQKKQGHRQNYTEVKITQIIN
ncbi:MAG: 50S ribosomal protein L21 [Candidatus Cloacimonetes bacterium]|nr:50S ribosomal protein L21 [Candidatus Cloacimonadota bacterium]